MNPESAVQFATNSRIHMGLAVNNLERSVAFYRTLFGQEPTKTRPGYAKFEVAESTARLSSTGRARPPKSSSGSWTILGPARERLRSITTSM